MSNIVQSVYEALFNATKSVEPMRVEIEKLKGEISSGNYSARVNDEKLTKIADKQRQIRQIAEETLREITMRVKEHCETLRGLDDLNADDLTDDMRLLNAGVKLTERDLIAMLMRNANNRSMKQIILRWVAENGVDLHRYVAENNIPLEVIVFANHGQQINEAEGLVDTSRMFIDHWLNTSSNFAMLERFFVTG